MKKKVVVIGAGFAGVSAASGLAAKGFDVTILEKNSSPGGRSRKFEEAGYVFDLTTILLLSGKKFPIITI